MFSMSTVHVPSEHSAAYLPFTMNYRLSLFRFQRGILAEYAGAPGGAFGKVLVGVRTKGNHAMAIKVIDAQHTSHDTFIAEATVLNWVREKVEVVRELHSRGVPLTLADRGAQHIVYVYGTGVEELLSAVDAGLPQKRAFLLVVEPLKITLTDAFLRPGVQQQPIAVLLRMAHEIALALAFLAHHRVVVSYWPCLDR